MDLFFYGNFSRTCYLKRLDKEVRDYWNQSKNLLEILPYLSTMGIKMERWQADANVVRLVAGAVENDSI